MMKCASSLVILFFVLIYSYTCVCDSFAARCAAPGVLLCEGFDNQSSITPHIYSSTAYAEATVDNTMYVSGGGSMRLAMQQYLQGNGWQKSFAAVGDNDTVYFQFRQRFDQTHVNSYFSGGGWKSFIFWGPSGSSCTTYEISQTNAYYRGFPAPYRSCGAGDWSIKLPPFDYLLNYPDFNCHYHPPANQSCAVYVADQWLTYYIEVELGVFGTNTTNVTFSIAYGDGPMLRYIDARNTVFPRTSYATIFNNIMLTNYITGKNSTYPHPTAYTWYDELIVSTKPIAKPDPLTPIPVVSVTTSGSGSGGNSPSSNTASASSVLHSVFSGFYDY